MQKKLVAANIGMKFGMSHIEGAMQYGAEIGVICDSDAENLRFAGERYSIPPQRWHTDYRDIVNDDAIDIVTVAVPALTLLS
jgi:predicted dehydrogenase